MQNDRQRCCLRSQRHDEKLGRDAQRAKPEGNGTDKGGGKQDTGHGEHGQTYGKIECACGMYDQKTQSGEKKCVCRNGYLAFQPEQRSCKKHDDGPNQRRRRVSQPEIEQGKGQPCKENHFSTRQKQQRIRAHFTCDGCDGRSDQQCKRKMLTR